MILSEVLPLNVCRGGVDFVVERDDTLGWTVGTMYPGAIYTKCVACVQEACARLRKKYDLDVEPKQAMAARIDPAV